MRGNHDGSSSAHPGLRSIPACAGEPLSELTAAAVGEVYPRVCGGTATARLTSAAGRGLSPRVRGNRQLDWPVQAEYRSIPACAGEPQVDRPIQAECRVYPRVCGGTRWTGTYRRKSYRLSPRVRGNPPKRIHRDDAGRSIPACAGEPGLVPQASRTRKVYPRVCGGTRR